jgi:hypothetical protein
VDGNSKGFGCLEIDHQLELGRLLDRNVGWLRAAQNLVNQFSGAPEHIGVVRSVGDQAPGFGQYPQTPYNRQPRLLRQTIDANRVAIQERVDTDIERFCVAAEFTDRGSDIVSTTDFLRSRYRDRVCALRFELRSTQGQYRDW